MAKIRVAYNATVIVEVTVNDGSTTYYPNEVCCWVEMSDKIKDVLTSWGYDTTPIDNFINGNN